MTIQLNDKSNASVRHVEGQAKVTFHSIDKAFVFPAGIQVTIAIIEQLYANQTERN